jgi:hypothetical protein
VDLNYEPTKTSLVETILYESIQNFGETLLYSTCDGIPRIRFKSTPTSSQVTTVSVTQTNHGWYASERAESRPPLFYATPSCLFTLRGDFCPGEKSRFDFPATLLRQDLDGRGPSEQLFGFDCPSIGHSCDAVMSLEIVMLFWPPEDNSPNICSSNETGPITSEHSSSRTRNIVTMTDITFRGQDIFYRGYVVNGTTRTFDGEMLSSSVLKGTFTFTSPTVYIAHHPISAWLDNIYFSEWSETLLKPAGILTVNPADVFSIRPLPPNNAAVPTDYAVLVANGDYNPDSNRAHVKRNREIVPFNFKNLLNPVPASVYYDARTDDCWGKQNHCGTITDDTYRPHIWIKGNILQKYMPKSLQGNFTCYLPDLYDPPMVLQAINTMDLPTLRPLSNIAEPTPLVEQAQPQLARQPGNRIVSHSPSRTSVPYGLHTTAPSHMSPQRGDELSDSLGRNGAGDSEGGGGGKRGGGSGGRGRGGSSPGRERGGGGDAGRKSENYVSSNVGGKWKQIDPVVSKGGVKGLGEISISKSPNKAGKFTKMESGFQDGDDRAEGEVGKAANTPKSSTAAELWIPSRALLYGGYALMTINNILRILLGN